MPSAKLVKTHSNEIKLAKTPYASLAHMIPSVVNKIAIIDIVDANCPIANAIRRTLISELPIKHLTISQRDIHSTDPYVIDDVIKKRVEMLPISQSIDSDAVFSLRFENDTDSMVDVPSHEIKFNGVSASKDIVPNVPVCNINSKKSFSLNNIHVATSYGFDNARTSIGRVGYQIMDADFSKSAQETSPKHFRLEIEVAGINEPIYFMIKAIESLIERLDAIDYNNATIEFNVYKLSIPNETYTISKMISYYIYQLEPTIEFVSDRLLHPSKRYCIIDILHPDAKNVCIKAVDNIKKDLKSILKSLK